MRRTGFYSRVVCVKNPNERGTSKFCKTEGKKVYLLFHRWTVVVMYSFHRSINLCKGCSIQITQQRFITVRFMQALSSSELTWILFMLSESKVPSKLCSTYQ